MELKKTPKADLENKRSVFVQLGLVIALGIVFMAFNMNDSVKSADSFGPMTAAAVEEEVVQITRNEEVKPPPPPPPPKVIEQINIIDDDIELEDEFEFESTEADDRTIIDAMPVIKEAKQEEDESFIYDIVEENPMFPGGEQAMKKWLQDNVKYPPIATENNISGRVYVNFVVNTDGRIVNAKVVRSVDPSLDQEALRVINMMPRWQPGKQRNKPVRVSFMLPINFTLN